VLASVALLVACHHETSTTTDGGTDAAAACGESTCIVGRWWIGMSSNCAVICSANGSLAECMQPDCEVIEASRYDADRRSLAPMLYSAQAHSFYLFGSVMTKTYATPTACHLQVGTAAPEMYTCATDTLMLPTATLQAATTAQAGALDAAAAANAPGRYSY